MRQPDVDPPIRTAQGRDFYQAYLNSPSWRVTRNRALSLAGYRCQRCQGKHGLEVHHRTYERLGAEWDQDLEVLCRECHGHQHDPKAEQDLTSIRLYLKIVGQVLHDRSLTTFADVSDSVKAECARLHIRYDAESIGKAVALALGKQPQRLEGDEVTYAPIASSDEPIDKSNALRILLELSEQLRQPAPKPFSMPPAFPAPNLAHKELAKRDEAERYQQERKRKSIREELEDIFLGKNQ